MDLKELRYFRAVAELGSFGKAATYLRIAQPALSRQVRKLEQELGVELLLRTARGVVVTPAGQFFLDRTIRLDRDMEETRRETSMYAEKTIGILRVGAAFPIAQRMLPPLIAEYRKSNPAVSIELVESGSGPLIDSLMEGELDVCLIEPPSHPHPELTCTPLWIEAVRLIGPANDRKICQETPMTLRQVAELPLILPSRHHSIRRLIDSAFARAHVSCDPVLEANGASLIIELVRQGLGYALLPTSAINLGEVAHFKVGEIAPNILRSVGIVARTNAIGDRAVGAFLEVARRLAPATAKSTLGIVGVYPSEDAEVAHMPDRSEAKHAIFA